MQLQVETQIYKKDAIKDGIDTAATQATSYITYVDENVGIQVHNKTRINKDFIQINATDISMWRNGKRKVELGDTYLTFYDGNGTADTNKLARFGGDIKIYKPGTGLAVIDINNQGAYIDGSVQIGGHAQGDYLNSNIKLGGTNLLRESTKDMAQSHNTYPIADFNFSESLIEGQQYTITAKITTSSEKKAVGFYHSGGSYSMSGWLPVSSDGYYNITFTATAAMATQTSGLGYGFCRVYVSNNITQQGTTTVTGTAHVDWIKIEKGNKATDWSPAPDDIDVHQYLRLEDGKLNIYQGNTKLASYGDTATIGKDAGPKFSIEGSTLKAYNSSGNQYFEVSSSGITYGNNIQVASAAEIEAERNTAHAEYVDAATKATNFLQVTDNGLKVSKSISNNNSPYVLIDNTGMSVYNINNGSLQDVAFFGSSARIGQNNTSRFEMRPTELEAYDTLNDTYFRVNSTGVYWGDNNGLQLGATVSEVTEYVEYLTAQLGVLNNDVNSLKTNVSNVTNTINTYLGSGKALYWNQGANLTLKSTIFKIDINSSTMAFKYNDSTAAYIDTNSKFNTNNIVISNSEQLGTKFKWAVDGTTRLTLMRI